MCLQRREEENIGGRVNPEKGGFGKVLGRDKLEDSLGFVRKEIFSSCLVF